MHSPEPSICGDSAAPSRPSHRARSHVQLPDIAVNFIQQETHHPSSSSANVDLNVGVAVPVLPVIALHPEQLRLEAPQPDARLECSSIPEDIYLDVADDSGPDESNGRDAFQAMQEARFPGVLQESVRVDASACLPDCPVLPMLSNDEDLENGLFSTQTSLTVRAGEGQALPDAAESFYA
jgi:hypothetical protein